MMRKSGCLVVACVLLGCGAKSALPGSTGSVSPGGPPGSGGIIAVGAGANTFFALARNGVVYSWGLGGSEVGVGESKDDLILGYPAPGPCEHISASGAKEYLGVCSRRPAIVPLPAEATGVHDGCALLADETLACWGANRFDEMGDGTVPNDHNPPRPPLRISGVADVSSFSRGEPANYAALRDGTLLAWGVTTASSKTPLVPWIYPLVSGVKQISVSGDDNPACALKLDGTVQCWGHNEFGQLGGPTPDPDTLPVTVRGVTNATQVDTGNRNVLVLLADGTMRGWGDNSNGSLGLKASPCGGPCTVDITDVVRFSLGGGACAIKRDGTLWCWGQDLVPGPSSYTPVPVDALDHVTDVAVGAATACAVQDGDVYCFGDNSFGELGDGSTVDRRPDPGPVAW
jgi:alpha-tubulin suppressor-like RCC1 family protein